MKTRNRKSIFLISFSLLISALFAPAAHAVDKGYRYWGYFQAAPKATSWSMAMTGPTVNIPDGSVEGWVFTFSGDGVPDTAAPRVAPDFNRICGSTRSVPATKKRIAITIDFGTPFIRPVGETLPRSFSKCVVLDKSALGIDVLGKVVTLRTASSGLICGLNNYPAKECGAEIITPNALKR